MCIRDRQCLSGYVLHNSLLHLLLENGDFLNTDISQGSVATRLGCDGVFVYDFVTNFLLSLTVKVFWKSANIWWSYGQELGVLFFLTHGVVCSKSKWFLNKGSLLNVCRKKIDKPWSRNYYLFCTMSWAKETSKFSNTCNIMFHLFHKHLRASINGAASNVSG